MNSIKVILPANEIPLDSKVFKIRGTFGYKLSNRLVIYGEGGQTVTPEKGSLFLIGNNMNISIISGNTELMWETDIESLHSHLDDMIE